MFKTYAEVFDQRGAWYHRAMDLCPGARREEFRIAIEAAEIEAGSTVCDLPSGGGYLLRELPAGLDVRLIAVDASAAFAREWDDDVRVEHHLSPLDRVPLPDASVDRILSIAGLHHEDPKTPVFREMRRLLRPGGRLVVLEVPEGGTTDPFLNDFVHRHGSLGHEGRFVDDTFRSDLVEAGFRIEDDRLRRYGWDFPDERTLVRYLKLMFGLDRADDATILRGAREFLGVERGDAVRLRWELQQVCCA